MRSPYSESRRRRPASRSDPSTASTSSAVGRTGRNASIGTTHSLAQYASNEVDESGVGLLAEVLVAEVAPADDGRGIVGHEHLVVHAVVEPGGIAEELREPAEAERSAAQERIEDPYLDVAMARERGEGEIAADRVDVVDEHPHAHAAVRRGEHV